MPFNGPNLPPPKKNCSFREGSVVLCSLSESTPQMASRSVQPFSHSSRIPVHYPQLAVLIITTTSDHSNAGDWPHRPRLQWTRGTVDDQASHHNLHINSNNDKCPKQFSRRPHRRRTPPFQLHSHSHSSPLKLPFNVAGDLDPYIFCQMASRPVHPFCTTHPVPVQTLWQYTPLLRITESSPLHFVCKFKT